MDCKISVEEKGEVARSISIEIPRELVNDQYERELRKAVSSAQVKGFRPGRAPKAVVAKMYGPQIQGEVLKRLISDAYQGAVRDHSLDVVGYPEIHIDNEDNLDLPLVVRADVSIYPAPELKDYFGVEFSVEKQEVSDGQIAERLETLRANYARLEPVTGRTTVEKGDVVCMDYEGECEGQPFKGSSGKDAYVEVGSGKSLPGIEDALTGMNVGEVKETVIVMPEGANAEVSGKEAKYTITLKSIFTRIVPELNDEFAAQTGAAASVEELKERVSEQLEREVKRANEAAREDKLFQAIIERNPFAVPQLMIDEEIRVLLFEMRLLDARNENSFKVDVTRFREVLGKAAEFRVRRAVALSRIIEQEGLKFNEDDVNGWLDELAAQENVSRAEVDKIYGFPKEKNRLKDMMASRKMIDQLLASAKITEEEKRNETAAG